MGKRPAATGGKSGGARKKWKRGGSRGPASAVPVNLIGSKGFLFTCDAHRQHESVREAYNLLEEYVDLCYPPVVLEEEANTEKSKSISELLKEEVIAAGSKKAKRFHKVDCQATGFVLILCSDPAINPVKVALKMCSDMKESGEQKTRFLARVAPLQVGGTCAGEDVHGDLVNTLRPLLAGVLDKEAPPTSFAVVYKRRHHDVSMRDSIVKLAEAVDSKHKCDLKTPNVAILLSVIKGTTFLSVVPQYTELQSLNFRRLVPQPQTHPPSASTSGKEVPTE